MWPWSCGSPWAGAVAGNAMGSLPPLGQYGCALQVPVPGFHANPGFASLSLRTGRKWKGRSDRAGDVASGILHPHPRLRLGQPEVRGGDLVMPLLGLSFRLCNIETGVLSATLLSFLASHPRRADSTWEADSRFSCKNCYGENRN